jgi:hypothetical protein
MSASASAKATAGQAKRDVKHFARFGTAVKIDSWLSCNTNYELSKDQLTSGMHEPERSVPSLDVEDTDSVNPALGGEVLE